MSLPHFTTQAELFSTAALSGNLFSEQDRYRLFVQLIYPKLVACRPTLAQCYCPDNGRVAIEPVLMLGVSILQEIDAVPDRPAVEMLRYHAGWNFALNRQVGDPLFHPTTLVSFRNRLIEHQQAQVAFQLVLDGLQEAGLISRQNRQRLDSTQVLGRVAKMSRLDCVREAIRLALEELSNGLEESARPSFWSGLWERYVETQVDYRANAQALARKLGEAGSDTWGLLKWLEQQGASPLRRGPQVQLLQRVFSEQFELREGQTAPLLIEKESVGVDSADTVPLSETDAARAEAAGSEAAGPGPESSAQTQFTPEAMKETLGVEPKGTKQLQSDRVQNPHDPEATYACKGKGPNKKEHVGYKVQVAESLSEADLAKGEPTRNFLTGILTHGAHESDEEGALKMEQEQERMGLEKPSVEYADGAYISSQRLAQALAEGRELVGPAPPSPPLPGRYTAEDFQVYVEERKAICPAGKTNTQCSRIEEKRGSVIYRFSFGHHCQDCPLRAGCLGKGQSHRQLEVGEHHTLLQARRQEQQSEGFKQRMHHRNGIEGTQSELVRRYGMRRARYRGLAKAQLQNYFIGAACNINRWIRRRVWELTQAAALSTPAVN